MKVTLAWHTPSIVILCSKPPPDERLPRLTRLEAKPKADRGYKGTAGLAWETRALPLGLGETVAHAALGEDVGGGAGVVAELAAEVLDEGADEMGVAGVLRAPDPS